MAVLGLCCCMWTFSSCGEQGLLSAAAHGFLIAAASLLAQQGLQGTRASVAVACGLGCSMACGLFPDQGLNLCSLR